MDKEIRFDRIVIDVSATGVALRNRRMFLGFSIKAVANVLNISEQALYKQEEGRSLPSMDCFVGLSYLYEKSIDDLLVVKKINDEINPSSREKQ